MKIISRQNMKFALVAVGIIVVMMAFRSRKPKSDIVGTPVSLAPIRIDTSPKALPQPVAQTPPVQSFVNQIPVQQVATLAPPATLVEPSVTVEPTEVPAPSIMVEDLAMVESPVGFENPANFESPEAFEFPPTIDSPPAETPTPAENPATGYQATGYQDFGNVGSSDGIVVDFSLTEAKPSIEPQRDETPDPAAAELDTDFDSDLSLSVDSDFEPEAFQQGPLEAAGGYQPNNQAVPVDFVEPVTEPTVHVSTVFLDDAAAQKAVHHIEYGKSLARRNATEAASQEFIGALRVLAESNDAATGGNSHAVALRNGMVAIREAIDFKSDDPQRQIVMNVPRIIEGHESAILGADEARNITASMAMRRYFEFAGRELGKCGGNNPVAAEALYCLGKMRTVTSATDPDPESIEINESIIFHHASLAADPSNFRSANELGVLLAKNGHLDAAETYLKNSLRIRPIPAAWSNLAKVHRRQGTAQHQQLANLADQEYQIALSSPASIQIQGPIQWVEPQEFAARSPAQIHHSGETVPSAVVPASVEQPENEKSSIVQRIGSLFSSKKQTR